MPNPTNPNAPSLIWDIFLYPTVAKRITGRNTVVDLAPKFRDPATHPAVTKVVILCDAGMAGDFWGPIVIERDNVVTIRDILFGIYEYYQTAMSEEEVQYVASLDPDNYTKMTDACYRRCEGTPALPGYVLRQGLKRVDCLGGKTTFHGIWVTMNPDNTWQMNLSLIGNRRRV
ncbi:hypothetical protein IEO21_05949 [Rhodonia placenta]|uniref:DUF6699 domain-containing protein n=1 Tax=Rhodonia placenta TaxID=104341 RepID=A0A8H7P183_9APHY|nr:hypothetical protein IEO21_05949 [Postia placenta]